MRLCLLGPESSPSPDSILRRADISLQSNHSAVAPALPIYWASSAARHFQQWLHQDVPSSHSSRPCRISAASPPGVTLVRGEQVATQCLLAALDFSEISLIHCASSQPLFATFLPAPLQNFSLPLLFHSAAALDAHPRISAWLPSAFANLPALPRNRACTCKVKVRQLWLTGAITASSPSLVFILASTLCLSLKRLVLLTHVRDTLYLEAGRVGDIPVGAAWIKSSLPLTIVMVSDEHYELCLPILQDTTLEDEDKTDKLEELLKKKTNLTGSSLDNVVLDALWRFREGTTVSASPPPIRQSILRRPSPASWRNSATPVSGSPRLGVSPLAPPGFVPSTYRSISSTASPFSSPRASPRLAFATPAIPHSPNLNAYEFASDATPAPEILGDYQTENVEWLVNDDAASVSSVGTSSGLNAAAPEFASSVSAQQLDMSPYDMLRSILGHSQTDDEIENALASHGYDLSATIASIMEGQAAEGNFTTDDSRNVLIGKSIASDSRPATPTSAQKAGVICKFYMSTGQCLRADCRFSHDLSNHLCKYWVMGNCLAGETCIFSHDPAKLASRLTLDGASTPPSRGHSALHLQDLNSFPSLSSGASDGYHSGTATPPPGFRPYHGTDSPRSRSRPSSRQHAKELPMIAPALDDNEAFPTLGSASLKQGKKHHGKRGGHGHAHKENIAPSSLADIVRTAPSPVPGNSPSLESQKLNGAAPLFKNGENSAAALAIPSPKHIPWLETGDRANKAYLKARQEAIKHGGLRNKFLQSAAQAWNRNDARAAKALSLRGQSENDLMRQAHREAARELYEERNKPISDMAEIYVDLHGLHPDEAVEYLEKILMGNIKESRPVYAITGTGNHSKNGKDKVGKSIRNFLNEWKYAYREFSVPGDRNNMGGILGIDARSWDKSLARQEDKSVDILSQGVEIGDGKVRLLVRDGPKTATSARR